MLCLTSSNVTLYIYRVRWSQIKFPTLTDIINGENNQNAPKFQCILASPLTLDLVDWIWFIIYHPISVLDITLDLLNLIKDTMQIDTVGKADFAIIMKANLDAKLNQNK